MIQSHQIAPAVDLYHQVEHLPTGIICCSHSQNLHDLFRDRSVIRLWGKGLIQ